jgi:hypothetical protein
MFRLINDAGLNYHEFLLRDEDGNVRACDVYIYLAGEKLTDTLRRAAIPLALQLSKSFLQRMTTTESAFIKHIDEFAAMSKAVQQQRGDEALRIFADLPRSLQKDKTVLLLRHQAASYVGEKETFKAVDDLLQYLPNDVCLDFLLIDYYFLRAEHDKALACIDRLDKAVGGDAFLDSRRADLTYAKRDVPAAYKLAEKAIAGAPALIDVYWELLGIATLERDHPRTLDALERIETNFETDLSGVHEDPTYAEFRSSPQGQEWIRKHPKPASAENN